MPTSARKSNNIRRGPQKAHIYRGDIIERQSERADGPIPTVQGSGRKRSLAAQQESDCDEEDGEQPMRIESPVTGRRSSIRPMPQTPGVDSDPLLPPRQMNSVHHTPGRNAEPGPSGLSRTGTYREPEPSSDLPIREPDFGGEARDQSMFDDYRPQEVDSPGRLPRETSFSRIEQDEDDGEEQEEDPEETLKALRRLEKGKGKSKEELSEQDHDEAEDEFAEGSGDVDVEPESDASRDGRPQKKRKTDAVKQDNKTQREGTRRSRRKPLKPLAYWRGERYIYGGKEGYSGPLLVPLIKEVVRIPEEPHLPLSKKPKRPSTHPKSRSRDIKSVEDEIPPAVNTEEGWDDETDAKCTVLHYTTGEEVERRIAWTAKMVQPRAAADHGWLFHKVLGDSDFISAGEIVIPPKGCKPRTPAKATTYSFYVIEGAVNFEIHKTSMVVATGGMFMVPRGNSYKIENICNRDARLFFTQTRRVVDEIASERSLAEAQKARLSGRSSSVGAPPTAKVALPKGRAASQP